MSRDEGGVWTVSSSVLRTRFRRAAAFGATLFFAGARRAGRLFRRAGRLLRVGRFPEPPFFLRFDHGEGLELVRFRFWAFRLAIGFVPFEP